MVPYHHRRDRVGESLYLYRVPIDTSRKSMNRAIVVDYDARTKRLVMSAPFFMVDALREFPSRRFDPKTKTWRIPLVAVNVRHMQEVSHKYEFKLTPAATAAVRDHEAISAAPKMVPFPRHVYDFTRSPSGFKPMDHQNRMLDLAWGLKAAAWFARMGTGKTFAAIHLACARYQGGLIDGVMIISPSTLRATWKKEFAKYATGEYDFRIHETKAPWLKTFYSEKPPAVLQVLAVSVEGFGVSESLYDSACGFMVNRRVMIICDESSRIKSPQRKRTMRSIEIGAVAEYRIILNGTPIALGIQDLWAQYEFLDPNIIGSGDYWAFRTRYVEMGGFENKQIIGYKNVDELMQLIIPYTCEVSKDVLNLPPKVMKPMYCEATPEQKKLFRLIVKGTTGDPNDDTAIKVDNVLERILRLRQVAGGYLPRLVVKSKIVNGEEVLVDETIIEPLEKNPKLDLLKDVIEDHYESSKFIIWTTFVHEVEAIKKVLASIYGDESVECYYGKTPMDERSRIEDRYCTDPKLKFFIGNPSAAGLGLTLVSDIDDVMVYYSGTNAYIDRAQSEDRAHRKGQDRSVVVIDLVMERSIDELIQQSIADKMNIEEFVIDRIKAGAKAEDLLLGGV